MCMVMVVWISWGSCGWPCLALCDPVGLSHQLVSTHCTFLLYSQPRLPQLHRSGQNSKHLQHHQILTLFYGHQTFFIVEERMWTWWKKWTRAKSKTITPIQTIHQKSTQITREANWKFGLEPIYQQNLKNSESQFFSFCLWIFNLGWMNKAPSLPS